MTADPLATLRCHLDAAVADGAARAFWWRDDDAVRPGPRLDRTLTLAERHRAPVALAVIPARLEAALMRQAEAHGIALLQHGVAHRNHEPQGKAAELGEARPVAAIVAECAAARPPGVLPIMVPPWNRMRPDLGPALVAAGYRGFSLFGAAPAGGRIDTHIDPTAWRGDRALQPGKVLAAQIDRAFAQDGPIGLLTHHAAASDDVEAFVAAFVALVTHHPGAVWRDARELWPSAGCLPLSGADGAHAGAAAAAAFTARHPLHDAATGAARGVMRRDNPAASDASPLCVSEPSVPDAPASGDNEATVSPAAAVPGPPDAPPTGDTEAAGASNTPASPRRRGGSDPFTALEGLPRGALFGLDVGTKTIGVAVSDAGRRVASPLTVIRRTKFAADAADLLALAARYEVVAFVVGMPFNMDGSTGPRAQSTRDFARNLGKLTDRPIAAWDERWSTVAAERALIEADASRARRRRDIDKVAAALILQGALDRLRALD